MRVSRSVPPGAEGAPRLTRRELTAATLGGWLGLALGRRRSTTALPAAAAPSADALTLHALADARPLPERMFGFNAPVPYDIPHEDPLFAPAVARLEPHYLRFPGGTVANYFDWRSGQLSVPRVERGASIYRTFLVQRGEPASRRLHPNGVTIEQFAALAKTAGAEIVFVPNLESSTVAEQAAWFEHMHALGIVPRQIELGNEFYLALLMDAETLRIFPDWQTTLERSKEYLDGFSRYLPAGARVAVQAAGSRFHHTEDPGTGRVHHEWQWDDAMTAEPWFQAVTTHLYPGIDTVAGEGASRGLPATLDRVYPAMLARIDAGTERVLEFLEGKLPDKEIWITEWGAFAPEATFGGVEVHFDGMWLHMVARGMLAMLRHPAVTVATYHSMFASGNLMSLFRRTAAPERYAAINAASLLHWFHQASRGPGVRYQRIAADGAQRIGAHGTVPGESFDDVEGGLFLRPDGRVLILHNAWGEPKRIELAQLGGGAPASAETLATPDLLASLEEGPPPIRRLEPAAMLEVPPYSITRLVWI